MVLALGLVAPVLIGPLRELLLVVGVGSLTLPLALGSACASIPRLRALLSRVRSRVFAARGHVFRPQSGNTGRFGSPGGPTRGSWRSYGSATGFPSVSSRLSLRFQ